MQEKIGNVTLDYEYYPGEDLYSDGPVEEELLEIAKNYQEKELNQLIYERNSWPVLYHFSHIRKCGQDVSTTPSDTLNMTKCGIFWLINLSARP